MSACVDAVRLRLSDAQSAAAVQAVLVADNHLQPQHLLALAEQLCKFPALKQLDASSNPRLRLLPVGVLQMAASLEAFSCQGCSLVLPPQSFFSSSPEENPMRIRQLLQSGSSDTQLTLSSLDLTAAVAREVAALLRHYPALKQLDVSANPGLDHAFVSEIGKALSSKAVLLHHHCVFSLRHQHLPHVLTVLQELHILLSSTSAALASRACPMTLCSICLVFNV